MSRKPGRRPRLRYSRSASPIRPSRSPPAAVDAGRVGAPREAVREAQDDAVELEALAAAARRARRRPRVRRPPASAAGYGCENPTPCQASRARSCSSAPAGRRAARGAAAPPAPRRRAEGCDARPGARCRARAAYARLAPVYNGRYAGVHPAAVAQPLDARDLAAALKVVRAREHPRAHPRRRPQLHRRLDRRRRRRARPAGACAASSCCRRHACWRAPACARSS